MICEFKEKIEELGFTCENWGDYYYIYKYYGTYLVPYCLNKKYIKYDNLDMFIIGVVNHIENNIVNYDYPNKIGKDVYGI